MFVYNKKVRLVISMMAILLLSAACASRLKKAEIAATANPTEEIAKLESEIQEGYGRHLDIVDDQDFTKAQSYLNEAKSDLASNQSRKEVLDDVAYGQSYLQAAREKGEARSRQIPAIIEAREKAISAGARNYPPTQVKIKNLDDDVRSYSKDFAHMSSDDMARLQSGYLDLELDSIIAKELGTSKGMIEGARSRNAQKYSPKALKQAEADYAYAENVIRANRNAKDSYQTAVDKATTSGQILAATLKSTQEGRIPESTAAELVGKDRQIGKLTRALDAEGQAADARDLRLEEAQSRLKLQEAFTKAREQFDPAEAEVFQQGDQLLIRLKKVNFPSGSANLPATAMPTLAKVRDVAKDLGPASISVEGHTDSTGSKQINQRLSQDRANAVATYLEENGLGKMPVKATGFGFEKPLAPNKTKDGRLANRRVDIVISPETTKEKL